MIQLGQLSLFVMARLASRLPFQSAHVPLHWTYQLNSFRKKQSAMERNGRALDGKKWNKECSNKHITHLNAEANYRDKCNFFSWQRIFAVQSEERFRAWSDAAHERQQRRRREGQETNRQRKEEKPWFIIYCWISSAYKWQNRSSLVH